MKVNKSVLIGTKVITGLVRFSYANVFTPKGDGEDKKYSVSLIIPKEDKLTIKNIKEAIKNAYEIGKETKFKGKKIKDIFAILHDGDEERPEDPVYENSYYINASAKTKPGIVDKYKRPIEDTTEFYSGCYGYASINLYPYNTNGNKGIACGLSNLMKFEDGESLGGRASAEDDFKGFGEELDDFDDDFDDDLEDDDDL